MQAGAGNQRTKDGCFVHKRLEVKQYLVKAKSSDEEEWPLPVGPGVNPRSHAAG